MSATYTLWRKHMTKFFVHTEEVVGMLIQPILWMVLFGTGMTSMLGLATAGDNDAYISFLLPGIIALTALGGAIGGGSTWLTERIQGIVKEYVVAPIPRLSILLGNGMSIVTKALFQSLIILIVGVLMGANVSSNPLGWLGALLLVGGYALGFAGIALAFASKTDSPGAYHSMIFILNLPLLFLSNALYPLETLPTWMEIGARLNPTTYVVTGMREMLLDTPANLAGAEVIPLWLCFLAVVVFVGFGLWLAYSAFISSIK
jgi:ABC-2 type transport system permease protein